MVLDIGKQAFQLEGHRLRLFLNWLTDHSSEMKISLGTFYTNLGGTDIQERFQSAVKTWLQSLPAQGMLWEYRTISFEIAWWLNLDPVRLKMIVESKTG
jgi:hypothetical protein